MTTASPQRPATVRGQEAPVRAIPVRRLVLVELRKAVDTRSGLWLLAAIGVASLGALVIFGVFGPAEERTVYGFAGMALLPQTFLLPVLGILLVTSEWSARAGLVTFTLEPRRGLVVLAKTVAAVVLGLAGLALLLVVAGAATALAGTGDQAWDLGARDLGYLVLLQLLAVLQGVAFGLLLMNSTAAIVLYFALPVAMNLLVQFVAAVRDHAAWFDLATSQAPLYTQVPLTGEQWAQLGATALLWVGLPLLVGYLRLRRREITTA